MTLTPLDSAFALDRRAAAGVERVDEQHAGAVGDRGLGLRLHRAGAALRVVDLVVVRSARRPGMPARGRAGRTTRSGPRSWCRAAAPRSGPRPARRGPSAAIAEKSLVNESAVSSSVGASTGRRAGAGARRGARSQRSRRRHHRTRTNRTSDAAAKTATAAAAGKHGPSPRSCRARSGGTYPVRVRSGTVILVPRCSAVTCS